MLSNFVIGSRRITSNFLVINFVENDIVYYLDDNDHHLITLPFHNLNLTHVGFDILYEREHHLIHYTTIALLIIINTMLVNCSQIAQLACRYQSYTGAR